MLSITFILTVSYKRHQTSPITTLIPENLKHISSTCPCSNGDCPFAWETSRHCVSMPGHGI